MSETEFWFISWLISIPAVPFYIVYGGLDIGEVAASLWILAPVLYLMIAIYWFMDDYSIEFKKKAK